MLTIVLWDRRKIFCSGNQMWTKLTKNTDDVKLLWFWKWVRFFINYNRPNQFKFQFVRKKTNKKKSNHVWWVFFCTTYKNNAFERHLTNNIIFLLNALEKSENRTERDVFFYFCVKSKWRLNVGDNFFFIFALWLWCQVESYAHTWNGKNRRHKNVQSLLSQFVCLTEQS